MLLLRLLLKYNEQKHEKLWNITPRCVSNLKGPINFSCLCSGITKIAFTIASNLIEKFIPIAILARLKGLLIVPLAASHIGRDEGAQRLDATLFQLRL